VAFKKKTTSKKKSYATHITHVYKYKGHNNIVPTRKMILLIFKISQFVYIMIKILFLGINSVRIVISFKILNDVTVSILLYL
jgi:hypothetical protein